MEKILIDPIYIFGYENPKNLEILASLIRAIELDIELPPVQLVKVSDTEYHIPYKTRFEHNEGGHHRALAHLLLGTKISCEIVNAAIIPEGFRVAITKINVIQDWRLFMEHIGEKPYIQPSLDDLDRTVDLYNDLMDL